MKKLTLVFVLSFFLIGFSQQKDFKINWDGSKLLVAETYNIEVPHFQDENFSFSHQNGLKFISQWKSDVLIDQNTSQLLNIQYASISSSELKGINIKDIPKSPQFKLKNAVAREAKYLYLEISPIVNQNGVLKRITSFSIQYNRTSMSQLRNNRQIFNSVLDQGSWYKFYVEKTGVYRLSKDFLNSLGVNTNGTDPRTIKIYGQGGNMLPLVNSEFYPLDPTENAIKFIGEEDGVFNNEDYILFYAEGPGSSFDVGGDGALFDVTSNTNHNVFTDKAYYFINVSSGFGKRIQPLVEPQVEPDELITTYHEYQFHELDEFNLAQLGRRWFGDRFDFENEKTFEFEFPNIVSSEPANLKVYAAATGEVPTSMELKVNNTSIATMTFAEINDPILGDDDLYDGAIQASQNFAVNLVYNNNGNPSSLGFLDFISIEALSNLTHNGQQFIFRNKNVATQSGVGQYTISSASGISEVWHVTDKFNVSSFSHDGSTTLNFKSQLGELRNYVVVDPSDYYEPLRESNTTIANQNLKGTVFLDEQGQFEDIDYLVITRPDMLSQAERLAQINKDKYGLTTRVYTLQEIYNEFSSGNQDVAGIRNFVKYIYDNASSQENRLKYLCIFGDGSFDYKDRISNNTNIVPSWYSYSSFSLSGSFVSDDFYGMMDENEGSMDRSDKLDIAVGRILADTPQRAKDLVDKIESYYAKEAFGSWRNNIIMIADDVNESWEAILQDTSNDIANTITQNKPAINALKVFSDSYIQESSSGGDRYPSVNRAIFDAVEVGALVVNYFGHGGEDGLAAERIWDKINAQEVNNVCKLNLFVTVTCEYTKFDNPNRDTAGEFTYWNKEGGAIALVTTTRQIFVSVGVAFNIILEDYLFALNGNEEVTVAEALRLTKNDPTIATNQQKPLVFFIGDPAMKLAFAKPDIQLTEINGVPVNQQTEPLEALSRANFKGQVTDQMNNVITDYNGVLTATIYDKGIDRSTLGNDGTTQGGQLIILDYDTLGSKIFSGQATITNGEFEFEFVVPRDIGIPVGNGKVSFYAQKTSALEDQSGFNFDIEIGGLDENAPEDSVGPTISLFMNDENFVSGGITNEGPTLLAKLYDENGINTASGIGHDIVAILDGDETNPFRLNDYYLANVDDYQRGEVTYPFRDLEPGLHTLTLKAWDVYNNSSTTEIQFVVHNQDDELVVENVLNYPNPFINYTEFWFNHNSSDVLDVSIQIFTISGKLVKTINGQTTGGSKVTSSISRDLAWDGKDDFGDKIGKGVYVYKLIVQSPQRNKRVEKIQKLVIL
jgi:hypothetical protein